MEKLLIFMYKHWIAALLSGLFTTVACMVFVGEFGDGMSGCMVSVGEFGGGMSGRIASLLPFQLIVTIYYVSMLIVRRRYKRTDEVRYRAHYIRGIFYLLFLISWLFPLMAFLIISV